MTRADRRTLVRQLHEEGLSQRAIAKRLKVSKDTVRRDLEAIDREDTTQDAPPGEPQAPDAPQASSGSVEQSAPQGGPVAQVPDPLAGIDVSQWRGLRRELAVLAQTGSRAEALVHQAVIATAYAYKQALARGDIAPGVPFLVSSVRLTPLPHRAVQAERVEAV